MNNLWKKGIAVACLCSLFLGIVGCGEEEQPAVDEVALDMPAWERYADTPITLDWYIDYSWFVGGWGENLVSKTITEETGVSVNFVTPKGNEGEMLNSMISSDSLPDLITLGWWNSQVNTMIKSDMVYALNELADEYDAYFYEVVDPVVVSWYTNNDGNIYCYPNSSCTPQDVEKYDELGSNQTFLVRKDIYEAIGCPDMTTIEGFSAAVKKAVEMYPEVDGKPLIPIGAHEFDEMGCVSFDKYLMNFLAVPWEEDGVYYDRYTDPEYLRWLKAFRQLGQEGYLADCIFTDTRTQMSEKIAEGRYFCMFYQRTDLADQQKLLYADNPDSIYMAVDGPRNSRGDDYVLPTNSTNGWTVTLISKNCNNPERAIALMDYMLSEHGQKVISLGVEGEMYDIVDGEYVIREEVLDLLYSDREEYNRIYGADNTYWMLQNNVMQLEWMPGSQEPLLQMEEWTYPYTQYQGQYEVYFPEDSQVGNVYTKVNTLWSKTLPQLLLAESDEEFDAIMESFVAEREALGFELLVEEESRQIHENMERLGME
ncbi:MAG: extracellular solute-binding protein [Lachnospiraceae bacterium]|nr:extracellular solute-binding protein [Lachnospiraceae bacterium]